MGILAAVYSLFPAASDQFGSDPGKSQIPFSLDASILIFVSIGLGAASFLGAVVVCGSGSQGRYTKICVILFDCEVIFCGT